MQSTKTRHTVEAGGAAGLAALAVSFIPEGAVDQTQSVLIMGAVTTLFSFLAKVFRQKILPHLGVSLVLLSTLGCGTPGGALWGDAETDFERAQVVLEEAIEIAERRGERLAEAGELKDAMRVKCGVRIAREGLEAAEKLLSQGRDVAASDAIREAVDRLLANAADISECLANEGLEL